jgi:hypothetical protein
MDKKLSAGDWFFGTLLHMGAVLSNVLPRPAEKYVVNRSVANAEASCEISNGAFFFRACLENDLRLFFCQFGRETLFSVRAAAFLSHVSQIIGFTSKKEMIWIYARSIIASVANANARIHFASVIKFVREAMRINIFHTRPRADANCSIAVSPQSALPNPASFSLGHIVPKSLGYRFAH